ncbi:MAG TPA: hypothetical protein VN714_20250 [Trebonia sp.]|nr:hypothetical protein [Trebonia sp.]
MVDRAPLADLINEGRLSPAVPGRVGRHDVLIESNFVGTFVYQIRGDRVLMLHGNKGYRDDVAAALLDAVDGLADGDLGSTVQLIPIDVAGFALDRAALLGPGYTSFFTDKPLADRGLQVIPVHRSEVVEGEESKTFWPGIIGRNLAIRHHDWTREPSPRADVRRLDGKAGGPLYNCRKRPALMRAEMVLQHYLHDLPDGVQLSVTDVRGHELRLHRDWDRLRGTLHVPGRPQAVAIDIPRHTALAAFGPLFGGADFEPAALEPHQPPEHMLMMRVNDAERRRADDDEHPASLDKCLGWLAALAPTDGNYLVFIGRSAGVVQMRWEGPGEPRLWLETPEPSSGRSRGRHVTRDEAATVIQTLARDDRVAVDDLGNLETRAWEPQP